MTTINSASNEVPDRVLKRVLADLSREDQRNGQLYSKARKFERKPIYLKVEIVPVIQGKGAPDSRMFVWVRNLSRSGASLVSKIQVPSSEIGVRLLEGDNGPTWMHGQVVRERQIQEGFWEIGVKFIGSLQIPG